MENSVEGVVSNLKFNKKTKTATLQLKKSDGSIEKIKLYGSVYRFARYVIRLETQSEIQVDKTNGFRIKLLRTPIQRLVDEYSALLGEDQNSLTNELEELKNKGSNFWDLSRYLYNSVKELEDDTSIQMEFDFSEGQSIEDQVAEEIESHQKSELINKVFSRSINSDNFDSDDLDSDGFDLDGFDSSHLDSDGEIQSLDDVDPLSQHADSSEESLEDPSLLSSSDE